MSVSRNICLIINFKYLYISTCTYYVTTRVGELRKIVTRHSSGQNYSRHTSSFMGAGSDSGGVEKKLIGSSS